jgi:hypothetical protein
MWFSCNRPGLNDLGAGDVGYFGVHKTRRLGEEFFQVEMMAGGERVQLGKFATAEEAARAWDAEAIG